MESKRKYILAAALITIIGLLIIFSPSKNEKRETHELVTSRTLWIPTSIINDSFGTTTSHYYTGTTTPTRTLVAYPFRAGVIIYTLYDLMENKTHIGSVSYDIYGSANVTNTKYISLMSLFRTPLLLTVNKSFNVLTNTSITVFNTKITVNYTNTYAILTLVHPDFKTTIISESTVLVDMRLLSPITPATNKPLPRLPIIIGKKFFTILKASKILLPFPSSVHGQIAMFYLTDTVYKAVFDGNKIIVNGTPFTQNGITAVNETTSIVMTKLTENPIYSLPETISCTAYPNGVYECTENGVVIRFNRTIISYMYTFVTNDVTLTEVGWFAYPTDASTIVKTITIIS